MSATATTTKTADRRMEAEYAVLGAIVCRPHLFNGALGAIQPELFDDGIQRQVIEKALREIIHTETCSPDKIREALAAEKIDGAAIVRELDEIELWGEMVDEGRLGEALSALLSEDEINLRLAQLGKTDDDNGRRLVVRHGVDLRFMWPWHQWMIWSGQHWATDENGAIRRYAKNVARRIYAEAALADDHQAKELAKAADRLRQDINLRAMLSMASSEPSIAMVPAQFDQYKYLMTCLNGTVNLKDGKLQAHRREDYITKVAPVVYDPAAECPRWMAFLERIMGGPELIAFLQRAVGYSLTGDTGERVLFMCYGTGGNGKSVFLETMMAMFGGYALRTPTETLMARRPGSIPNDVARLRGARFVTAAETDENRRLAEATVKDLTGGDTISARFMRANWFDFRPECKLWLATNHKPVIRGTDRAIWDRIRLIPFNVTIPEQERDLHLKAKLAEELPGILAWAVRGCLQWQGGGLGVPDAVREATAEYRTEMDVIGAFLDECCDEDRLATVTAKIIYKAYLNWCEANGERPITQRRFGGNLTERGYERRRGVGNRHEWGGIRLIEGEGVTH